MVAGPIMAQQFDFESDKKNISGYSRKVVEAIDNNDIKKLRKLFEKDPSLVDTYAVSTNPHGYLSSAGGGVPLLYDVVGRCLNNQCSVELVKTVLDFEPHMYCTYNNITPFYLILTSISTKTIDNCIAAHELFYAFLDQPNFSVSQKPKDLPLPLSYLISSNYDYLYGDFNKDYISPDIIKAFIEKGASINTRDIESNSILIHAVIKNDVGLIDFCVRNNADLTIKNLQGKDALFYAVKANSSEIVNSILEANYPISEGDLVSMGVSPFLHKADKEIQNRIFNRVKDGKKDLQSMINIAKLFPDRKLYFISEAYSRSKYQISTEDLPSFIALFKGAYVEENIEASKNLESLIVEYKTYIIKDANKTGEIMALIDLQEAYGLTNEDYKLIDERAYLVNTRDIQLYKKIFPSNHSEFASRCKLNDYYLGPIRNGLANGTGTALNERGLFSGVFADGQGNGKMKIVFKNGYTYNGDVKNGVADGEGSDSEYKGSWKKGQRHGYGILSNYKRLCGFCPFEEYKDDVYYENGVLLRNLSDEARERSAERRNEEYRQTQEETVTARDNYEEGEWEEMSVSMLEAMFDVRSSGKMKKVWIQCPSSNVKRETEIYYSYTEKEYYVSASWLSNAFFDSYDEALEYALEKLDCY